MLLKILGLQFRPVPKEESGQSGKAGNGQTSSQGQTGEESGQERSPQRHSISVKAKSQRGQREVRCLVILHYFRVNIELLDYFAFQRYGKAGEDEGNHVRIGKPGRRVSKVYGIQKEEEITCCLNAASLFIVVYTLSFQYKIHLKPFYISF